MRLGFVMPFGCVACGRPVWPTLATARTLIALQENPQYPADFQRTDPPITTETASLLLATVVEALGRDKLLVPDDLRGGAEYLRQALLERGPDNFWPELESVRGKIILIVAGAPLRPSHPCRIRRWPRAPHGPGTGRPTALAPALTACAGTRHHPAEGPSMACHADHVMCHSHAHVGG